MKIEAQRKPFINSGGQQASWARRSPKALQEDAGFIRRRSHRRPDRDPRPMLLELLDLHIDFGQGYLFGEPRIAKAGNQTPAALM